MPGMVSARFVTLDVPDVSAQPLTVSLVQLVDSFSTGLVGTSVLVSWPTTHVSIIAHQAFSESMIESADSATQSAAPVNLTAVVLPVPITSWLLTVHVSEIVLKASTLSEEFAWLVTDLAETVPITPLSVENVLMVSFDQTDFVSDPAQKALSLMQFQGHVVDATLLAELAALNVIV